MNAGNNNAMYNSGMGQNIENEWGQGFGSSFPPLPEPGNSGSLVALSSARPATNQYAFNNQQDAGAMGGFGGQPAFGSQVNGSPFGGQQQYGGGQPPQYGGQQQYGGGQPQYGNQQPFGGQQFDNGRGFGGGQFGNQQEYTDNSAFDNQAGFGNNGGQQFNGPSFGPPSQPLFQNRNQPPSANPNLLPPPGQGGQSSPPRPRWQQQGGSAQEGQNFQNQPNQNQNRLSFNQDQVPFSNNG